MGILKDIRDHSGLQSALVEVAVDWGPVLNQRNAVAESLCAEVNVLGINWSLNADRD